MKFRLGLNRYICSRKYFSNVKKPKIKFDDISENFWNNKTPEIENMCGVGELNNEDLVHSERIFKNLKVNRKFNRALDVGAGIGRITFNVLYDKCNKIDLLDNNKKFLNHAELKQREIKGDKIENFYHSKIQNFRFQYNYDLIFVQWVLEYLDEKNFALFISNISSHLNNEGYVIIKENINLDNELNIPIEEEGSLIRPNKTFENCFRIAGLKSIHEELVEYESLPIEILDVKCCVLSKL